MTVNRRTHPQAAEPSRGLNPQLGSCFPDRLRCSTRQIAVGRVDLVLLLDANGQRLLAARRVDGQILEREAVRAGRLTGWPLRSLRPGRTSRTLRASRTDSACWAGRTSRTIRASRTSRAGRAGRTSWAYRAGRACCSRGAVRAWRTWRTWRTWRALSDRPGLSDQQGLSDRPGRPDQQGLPDPGVPLSPFRLNRHVREDRPLLSARRGPAGPAGPVRPAGPAGPTAPAGGQATLISPARQGVSLNLKSRRVSARPCVSMQPRRRDWVPPAPATPTVTLARTATLLTQTNHRLVFIRLLSTAASSRLTCAAVRPGLPWRAARRAGPFPRGAAGTLRDDRRATTASTVCERRRSGGRPCRSSRVERPRLRAGSPRASVHPRSAASRRQPSETTKAPRLRGFLLERTMGLEPTTPGLGNPPRAWTGEDGGGQPAWLRGSAGRARTGKDRVGSPEVALGLVR